MLGVFAKVVRSQSVKSRLQTQLSRQDAERFYVASLADSLETALAVCSEPVLFLRGGEDPAGVDDLRLRLQAIDFGTGVWSRLRVHTQTGADLGARLESAFEYMGRRLHDATRRVSPALIIGSDSPSLTAGMLQRGLELLGQAENRRDRPDVVLGPTDDGGYWSIGLRRPVADLLRNVEWSSQRTLDDTVAQCQRFKLRVQLLDAWTDVDRPEDLLTLQRQIVELRAHGDVRTARRVARVMRDLGYGST